jgi:hypothetical protein
MPKEGLPAGLYFYLHCISLYLPTLPISLLTYPAYLSTFLPTCLPISLPIYLPTEPPLSLPRPIGPKPKLRPAELKLKLLIWLTPEPEQSLLRCSPSWLSVAHLLDLLVLFVLRLRRVLGLIVDDASRNDVRAGVRTVAAWNVKKTFLQEWKLGYEASILKLFYGHD